MKYLLVLLLAISTFAYSTDAKKDVDYDDLFFPDKNPTLTAQEKHAIAIAKRWQQASERGMTPVSGIDGSIVFIHGDKQPIITCAVMQVCDIQLEAGENVNNIHLGDSARWLAEPAITGSGLSQTIHVIIKPLDVALDTTLIIATDRRSYNLRLRSHKSDFMPKISFIYPREALAKFENLKRIEHREVSKNTIPQTGEYLGQLDFSYKIDGKAKWKPVRVYNDGKKTIIQMPETMSQTEAPTLLVVRENNKLFSDDENTLVNYRLQNDRYIVDTVFDKAILIVGVGRNQTKVTITRGN
ncbi:MULTISPECIES: P-type conjugative transfer protein TrbG [Pseudoalteromonas]|uniref:P-type conjugative transfer protein TrbG n=1 Tax=Pseudoalteromonas TaxID=53246 RepID=UPI001EF675FB|nr:P-type conjugative transfer protein TrbG [Pseudoalteromonas sp. Of11M-6]MCG7556248.1 P-type conjugative transfer protein TrbG [Pseudoalteromonas sp. Of11M-6]